MVVVTNMPINPIEASDRHDDNEGRLAWSLQVVVQEYSLCITFTSQFILTLDAATSFIGCFFLFFYRG